MHCKRFKISSYSYFIIVFYYLLLLPLKPSKTKWKVKWDTACDTVKDNLRDGTEVKNCPITILQMTLASACGDTLYE